MGVINMLTDLALILFPVHVIVTLQMSMAKKVTILTFFGTRSLYAFSLYSVGGLFLTRVQRHCCNRSSDGLR